MSKMENQARTKSAASTSKEKETAVTFQNSILFAPSVQEGTPAIIGEQKSLVHLDPQYGHFKTVLMCPESKHKLGNLMRMSMFDVTKVINTNTFAMGTMCNVQISLEGQIRRLQKPETSVMHSLINYNVHEDLEPANLPASAKTQFEKPINASRESLNKLTVTVVHSQAQIFILRNIMNFRYSIRYQNVQEGSKMAFIQPIWYPLGAEARLIARDSSKTTVCATDTLEQAMTKIKYTDAEKTDLVTAILMLFHHRELDHVFATFTDSIIPEKEDINLNKEPELGVQCEGIQLTDFVQLLIQFPNISSLRHNMTFYSKMNKTSFNKLCDVVMSAVDQTLEQGQVFSSSSNGSYLTKFASRNIYNICNTVLDGSIATALIMYTKMVMPTVHWNELYSLGFQPQPKKTASGNREKLELYKSINLSYPVVYTAVDLTTGLITALRPGKATQKDKLANLTNVGQKFAEHHMLMRIMKFQEDMYNTVTGVIARKACNQCVKTAEESRREIAAAAAAGSGSVPLDENNMRTDLFQPPTKMSTLSSASSSEEGEFRSNYNSEDEDNQMNYTGNTPLVDEATSQHVPEFQVVNSLESGLPVYGYSTGTANKPLYSNNNSTSLFQQAHASGYSEVVTQGSFTTADGNTQVLDSENSGSEN